MAILLPEAKVSLIADIQECRINGIYYKNPYSFAGSPLRVRDSDKKKYKGEKLNPQSCWLCKKSTPEVTFKKEAHVIPNSLGNNRIFCYGECDDCNEKLGRYEEDLTACLRPFLSSYGLGGRNGVATIKGKLSAGDSAEIRRGKSKTSNKNMVITQIQAADGATTPFVIDETNKIISFEMPVDPYTPVNVLRAFTSIVLRALPREKLGIFPESFFEWLLKGDVSYFQSGVLIPYVSYRAAPIYPVDQQTLILRERRDGISFHLPKIHATIITGPIEIQFGIWLTEESKDKEKCYPVIFPTDVDIFGNPHNFTWSHYDLTAETRKEKSTQKVAFSYQEVEQSSNQSEIVSILEKTPFLNKNKIALYALGLSYEEGRGVEANLQKAIEFYSKASELGHMEATEKLKELQP